MTKLFLLLMLPFSLGAATYYIDSSNGSDGNNGLGPDASHASNKPWRSMSKFLLTNATVGGDVAYVAPGPYRQTTITLLSNWTSHVSLIGDPQNSQGFKTSGGVLVVPDIVRWTGYTNSDSMPTASGNNLTGNNRGWLKLANMMMLCPNVSGARNIGGGLGLTNLICTNMLFIGARSYNIDTSTVFGCPLNWTFDNCKFVLNNEAAQCVSIITTSGTGADYDLNVVFRNCEVANYGQDAIGTVKGGTSGGVAGGIYITNCSIVGYRAVNISGTSTNTLPVFIRNSMLWGGRRCIFAQDAGQVSEDYNALFSMGSVTLEGLAVGANSNSNNWSYHLDFGGSQMFGFGPRPYYAPLPSSPILGAGQNYSSFDFYRKTRPATNTLGSFELYTAPEISVTFGQ